MVTRTGPVSHAGTRLLADLADRTGLTGELSQAPDGVRGPRPRHDPGRVLVDPGVVVEGLIITNVSAGRPGRW
jgi:hypothetical protein